MQTDRTWRGNNQSPKTHNLSNKKEVALSNVGPPLPLTIRVHIPMFVRVWIVREQLPHPFVPRLLDHFESCLVARLHILSHNVPCGPLAQLDTVRRSPSASSPKSSLF